MESQDLAAAECLRQLLDEQASRLRRIALRTDETLRQSHQLMDPAVWSGPARDAHDALLRRVQSTIASARSSLDLAVESSVRAAITLAGRVG